MTGLHVRVLHSSLSVCVFVSLFLFTVCDNPNSTAQTEGQREQHVSSLWTKKVDITNGTHMENGCNCNHVTCGCCSHLEQHEIHLNSTVCSNVTYLAEDYGISLTVTVDRYTIFNETVSARNPPPVCAGAPYVEDLADVCVRLSDIRATRRSLHACASVEARMKHVLVARYDLGCFTIGNNNTFVESVKQVFHHDNDTAPDGNATFLESVKRIFHRDNDTAPVVVLV